MIILENPAYVVLVEDTPGPYHPGIGRYRISSGLGHPAGADQRLLLDSYSTIRSYTSNTDYVQASSDTEPPITDAGYTIVNLDPVASTQVINATSVNITYTLTEPNYGDNMTVVQNITIHGTNINDSRIAITTSITNTNISPINGPGPLLIGLRYFWDLGLDGDDGPTFQALNPNGSVLTQETTFPDPAFEAYELKNNQGSPLITLRGTVNGPANLTPPPIPPNKLQYAYWPTSNGHAFSYVTTNQNTDSDSALLTFWGDTEENAFLIYARQTVTVRTLLYTPTQAQPPSRGLQFSPVK